MLKKKQVKLLSNKFQKNKAILPHQKNSLILSKPMFMKNIVYIPFIISVFLLSCGKKNVTTALPTTAPACDCASNSTVTTPYDYTYCNGFFRFIEYHFYQNDTVSTNLLIADASFNNSPTLYPNYNNNILVNSVSINNISLDLISNDNNPYYSYDKGTSNLFSGGLYWQVSGANGIPTFDYRWQSTEPSANLKGLPTIISKSDLKAFPVNLVNGQHGTISIDISTREKSSHLNFNLAKGSNCICIKPEQIKDFLTGQGTIQIGLVNEELINVNGKNFKFTRTFVSYHKVQIID